MTVLAGTRLVGLAGISKLLFSVFGKGRLPCPFPLGFGSGRGLGVLGFGKLPGGVKGITGDPPPVGGPFTDGGWTVLGGGRTVEGLLGVTGPAVGSEGGVRLGVGDPPGVIPGVEGSEAGEVAFGDTVGGAIGLFPLPPKLPGGGMVEGVLTLGELLGSTPGGVGGLKPLLLDVGS